MNTISAKKKENIVKRMNGIAFMVPFYLIFFLFCFLLDPRKINVNSSYHGFAEFLPLWAKSIFAIGIFIGLCIFFFFATKEIEEIYQHNTKQHLINYFLLIASQIFSFLVIYLEIYFNMSMFSINRNKISVYISINVLILIIYLCLLAIINPHTKFLKTYLFNYALFFISLLAVFYFITIRTVITILILMLIPVMNDSFAYFSGLLFGRKKMSKNISPKKTYGGLYGGFFCSLIFIMLLIFAFSIADKKYAITLILFGIQWEYQQNFAIHSFGWWVGLTIIVIILIVVSIYGDLYFSLIKRLFKTKDYSNKISGHGGFNDRYDSTYFSVSTFFIISLTISFFSTVLATTNVDRLFNI